MLMQVLHLFRHSNPDYDEDDPKYLRKKFFAIHVQVLLFDLCEFLFSLIAHALAPEESLDMTLDGLECGHNLQLGFLMCDKRTSLHLASLRNAYKQDREIQLEKYFWTHFLSCLNCMQPFVALSGM